MAALLISARAIAAEKQELAFIIDRDAAHRVKVSVSLAYLGYDVMQFERADDAIAAARSLIPSLTLTDVFLPDDDGIETIEVISRLHPRCQMLAMLRSQETLAAPLLTALMHLGAGATVVKPVDHADLSAAIQRLRPLTGNMAREARPFPFTSADTILSGSLAQVARRKQA